MATKRVDRVKELEERLHRLSLAGLWQRRKMRRSLGPHLWRWEDISPCLAEAGEVIGIGADAERRVVKLVSPALADEQATSRTLQISFQLVNPGETAACHRHSIAALRFVIEGHNAYTTVDGERMLMEPGDLILTPSWAWHDHTNATNEPVVWLDGLDSPLTVHLEAAFQELYGEGVRQPVSRPDNFSRHRHGTLRPVLPSAREKQVPPYTYKWKDTLEALHALAGSEAPDPYDGVLLRYVNPSTGGYTMPTISCQIQMLQPGQTTQRHRHVENAIYHVVQGEGVTMVSKDGTDEELAWKARDCFMVPPWHWHEFRNKSGTERSILFSMSDRPIFEALGLYREEAAGERGQTWSPAR